MSFLINNGERQPYPNALEFVRYRVLGKPYSAWRAIMSEATGESDTLFKIALWQGHGVRIPEKEDPMVYIIQDTAQMRELTESGVTNPTSLQIFLSTKIASLTEQGALDRMAAWLESHKVQ